MTIFGLSMVDFGGFPGLPAGGLTCPRDSRQSWRMSTIGESDGLPGIGSARDPASRAAATRLVVRLCLPVETVLGLPVVGDVAVRTISVDRTLRADWLDDARLACAEVAIECAGQPGVLLIEKGLAVGLVNALLGLSMPLLAGPLSRIERGVLEGTLVTVLARLGLAPGVRLREEAPAPLPRGSFAIEFSVGLRGESGRAWFVASDAFLDRLWALREPGRKPVVPWLELAATSVPHSEMAGVEPGDLVVFDESAVRPSDEAWPVRARWGGVVVPARWLADGLVVAEESDVANPASDAVTRPERRSESQSGPATIAARGAIVQVSAGLVCPSIHGAAFAPLVVRRDEPVLVRAAGRPFAYGEIVDVDGALAVRITRRARA
jgi:hypothetical protein